MAPSTDTLRERATARVADLTNIAEAQEEVALRARTQRRLDEMIEGANFLRDTAAILDELLTELPA